MDLHSFKKKALPRLLMCLAFNSLFFIFIRILENEGGKLYFGILLVNCFVNAYFIYSNSRIINSRLEYLLDRPLKGFHRIFLSIAAIHLPLFGIYVLRTVFKKLDPSSLKTKKIFWFRFIPILVINICFYLIFFGTLKTESENILQKLYPFFPVTESYSMSVASEAEKIFKMKDNIKSICPDEKIRPDCVIENLKKHDAESTLSLTGVVLYIAIDAMEIFKYKNILIKEKQDHKIIPGMLIAHNVELLKIACRRMRPSEKFGPPVLGIIVGNLEGSLLDVVDAFIYKKLVHTAVTSLTKITVASEGKIDMNDSKKILADFKNSSCYKRTQY